jgi:hypothetical protein
MDKQFIDSALGKIWALTYRSTQERLTKQQEEELDMAIGDLNSNWDQDDSFFTKAQFVCQCARMHLADLRAVPPRKIQGWDALMGDCQTLHDYLNRSY